MIDTTDWPSIVRNQIEAHDAPLRINFNIPPRRVPR